MAGNASQAIIFFLLEPRFAHSPLFIRATQSMHMTDDANEMKPAESSQRRVPLKFLWLKGNPNVE